MSGLILDQKFDRLFHVHRKTIVSSPGNELQTALQLVWMVISLVMLAILLTPWVLTPRQIASITPKCEWKARYGRECAFCGMTTAFIEIADGRLREAERSNRGSVPLYAVFWVNEAVVGLWLWRRNGNLSTLHGILC